MASKVAELFIEIGANIDKFNAGFAQVEKRMVQVGKKMTAIGKSMTRNVTLPILALGTAALKMGADFDKAMTESLAIMGDVSDAMKIRMADAAKEMSTKTTFAANKLAEAYFFLASAGMDAAQSIKALPVVAKFAQAGAFDLATATDLLTDAQTALGLSSRDAIENQKNLIRVADVLVKANTLANASVLQFSESLTNRAAAALVNVNKGMEEGVAVLAAFADKGVKGQKAGMRLAMMLNALDVAARKNKGAWEEQGLTLFDAQGEMRSIGDIISDLEGALGSLTTEQRTATLAQLGFNIRTKASILTLLGSSEKIKQWTKDLKSAGGTMETVAEKQLQAFTNQMKLLRNILVSVGIQIGDILMPIVKKLVDNHIRPAIEAFSKLSDTKKKLIMIIAGVVAAVGPLLLIFGMMISTVIPALIVGVTSLGSALLFLATSPVGILLVAFAALLVMYHKVKSAQNELRKAVERGNDQIILQGQRWAAVAKEAGLTTQEMMKLTREYKGNYSALFRAIKLGKEGKELQEAYTKTIRELKGEVEKETSAQDFLTEALEKTEEALGKLSQKTEDYGRKIIETALPPARELSDVFDSMTIKITKLSEQGMLMFVAMTFALSDGIMNALDAFQRFGEEGGSVMDTLKGVIHGFVSAALNSLKRFTAELLVESLTTILAKKAEALAGVIASVMKSVPFPLNLLLVGGAIAAVSRLFSGLKPKKMEAGGFVPTETFAHLHAGERVLSAAEVRREAGAFPEFTPTTIQPIVNIYAQTLDHDTVRRAGELIYDELEYQRGRRGQ